MLILLIHVEEVKYMDLDKVAEHIQEIGDPDFNFVDYRNTDVPFTKLDKPLSETSVALISSGGFHLEEEKGFDIEAPLGDAGDRKIPRNTTINDLSISHPHYEHSYVKKDLNCAFPLELLADLEKEGEIGSLAETNYSFMGYCLKIEELINQSALEVASQLKDENIDAAILAPT